MTDNLNRLLALLLLSALAGCTLFQPNTCLSQWPQDIPARAEFEAYYAADARNQAIQSEREYLTWILRFYEGWQLYSDGWNDLVPSVLSEVEDPLERAELRAELYDAGRFIASEWAKDVDSRKVRTRQLSIWGNALREAIVRDDASAMVRQIVQDVDALMAQRITHVQITSDRYYAEDENDVFR